MEQLNVISLERMKPLGMGCKEACADPIQFLERLSPHWRNTDVSASVLFRSAGDGSDRVEDWRKKVVGEISGWAGSRLSDISQSRFWRSFDAFDKNVGRLLATSADWQMTVDLDRYEIEDLDLSTQVPTFDVLKTFDVAIFDGLHRAHVSQSLEWQHFLLEEPVRALSLREIRAITRSVVNTIESADVSTVASLLKVTREALALGIGQRIRWRIIVKKSVSVSADPEMTREHILGFHLRTGNPPPFEPAERRAGAVAVLVVFLQASKVRNEQICKQNRRRNLRVALLKRCRPASIRGNAQTPPSSPGCPQPARRRRIRANLQLAENARTAWDIGRGQMVPDIHMGGRGGGFRNTTRAAMMSQKGVQ
jgi:hypothetical protein